MTYNESMVILQNAMKEAVKSCSGGCTSVKDALYFENIKEEDTCLWYAGENDNCTFMVLGCVKKEEI